MSTEIKHHYYYPYLRMFIMALLLISSNQTTSFAGNKLQNFQQTLQFSPHATIEVVSQNNNKQSSVDGQQYTIKAYSTRVANHSPQLISAITRPLQGHILEVLIEDINNDQQKEIVVIMESQQTDKPFLMLDTYSFNGKKMLWKQKLPKNLLSSSMHTYLDSHEVPSSLPRNTAAFSLTP